MDNFDLKKFLKESKALENLNPSIKAINEGNSREDMKAKIKDMIVAELELDIDNPDKDSESSLYDPVFEGNDKEDEEDYSDYFFDIDTPEEDLEEAKKKEENVEDVEVTDTEEELPADEEMPAEEAPTGGIEDLAADMKGTEADLMDHLMKAFQIAKGMGNEKLETQVGNTLKFFVSEYIGGGQD
jgi:hypothetical protein